MDHDPVLEAVGPRLRSLRQQRQLSLAELSATTGISTSTLSRLESGGRKPTLELLLALARAYQVPLDDLVGAPPRATRACDAAVPPPRPHAHPADAAPGRAAGVQDASSRRAATATPS